MIPPLLTTESSTNYGGVNRNYNKNITSTIDRSRRQEYDFNRNFDYDNSVQNKSLNVHHLGWGIDPMNMKSHRSYNEKLAFSEEVGAATIGGYSPGKVKQTPNFVYNDAEKLIAPENLNIASSRIRGLGTPMSNQAGASVVSPAIVPPRGSDAFEKYMPMLAERLNMRPSMARQVVMNTPTTSKSFAYGGALPTVQQSIPNFMGPEVEVKNRYS